jgi:hypothetical protein
MDTGLIARISKPRLDRGCLLGAWFEQETVSAAVFADIGVAADRLGKVNDKVPHQCRRRAREGYAPWLMQPATRISKFKHLRVHPWTHLFIRLTFTAATPFLVIMIIL